MLSDQAKTIRELEIVVKGYEDNLGEPLRKVKEDVEREWMLKVDKEVKLREEKEAWADVLVKQLEKEKRVCIYSIGLLSVVTQSLRITDQLASCQPNP